MKFIITVVSYLLIISVSFSQEVKKKDKEQRIKDISEKFSVSKKRAQKIVEALDFNSDKILELRGNSTMKTEEKFLQLKVLNAERKKRVDSVLTSTELSLLQSGILLTSQQKQAKKSFIEKEKQNSKLPPNGKLLKP